MEKKRLEYLDVARGIAMLSIVLGHLGNPGINRVVFTYHLPIFYLISGYFFDEASTVPAFLRKKARQLLVPYYFTCLLCCLIAVAVNLYGHQAWNTDLYTRLFGTLYAAGDNWGYPSFTIHRIGAIWFLWALFWANVMLKLLLKCKPAVRVGAVALIFGVCCSSWRYFWLPLSIQAGGCALLYLYLGYLLRKAMPQLKGAGFSGESKAAGILLALATWLWTVRCFQGFWLVHSEINNGALDIVGSLCGCILLVLLSTVIAKVRPLSRALAFYGRYSLLFLTIHLLEMNFVKYKALYKKMLVLTGLVKSPGLYLGFRIAAKLCLITAAMLLLYRIPAIRRVFAYPPLQKIDLKD